MPMDRITSRDPKLRKLADLIGDIRFGVLTTIAEDGSLWSRPISTQQATPDGELWFFAKLDSPMANELRHHRRVSLCYAQPVDCSYVSISGTCELISDPSKAEELWDASYQKWLPGGPGDPSLILVRVTVERAEYWDAPSATWPLEAGFAMMPPDKRDDPEHHAQIDMLNEAGPVIVRTGPCPSCSTHHARCSHRTFPAALGVGETACQAAEDLLRRLNSQKDYVADRWHRDKVEAAIADVRAFLRREGG
jgi:general stress protein 26